MILTHDPTKESLTHLMIIKAILPAMLVKLRPQNLNSYTRSFQCFLRSHTQVMKKVKIVKFTLKFLRRVLERKGVKGS